MTLPKLALSSELHARRWMTRLVGPSAGTSLTLRGSARTARIAWREAAGAAPGRRAPDRTAPGDATPGSRRAPREAAARSEREESAKISIAVIYFALFVKTL